MPHISSDHIPVIAGIGEITDRPADVMQSLEPIALMAEAARRADEDARGLLREVDSVDIVGLVSWRYYDTPVRLNERLGIAPRRSVYGPVGGESPVRYLHEAAQRIARGESSIGLVVGGEAQYAVGHAKRAGVDLPWTPYAVDAPKFQRAADHVHPLGKALGVSMPVNVYPFYEAATAHHWGQTPAEAQAESGQLWSCYSAIAANNPYSWQRTPLTTADIVTVTKDNRIISWPYPKRMVANPNVNQGAAVILTSLARARAAGIPDEQLVFVGAGAWANEPRDWLARDHYRESHAQTAVLEAMLSRVGEASRFSALELYSCFPVVPKMAWRTLGLGPDVSPTVCGGLSFFGGPLNNHMTHAACSMVRALRGQAEQGAGLLYGQGEFVTKHHALILAREPKPDAALHPSAAQETADARRGPAPPTKTAPDGEGAIETFTVLYDPAGAPTYGVVILRLGAGARTLARVSASADIALLQSMDRYPIGARGHVRLGADGLPEWRSA